MGGSRIGLVGRGLLRATRNVVTLLVAPTPFPRGKLLRAYLPMLARQLGSVVRPSKLQRGGSTQILGREVRYLHFGDLVFGFEEMFVEQQYAFDATTAEPRILDCGSNVGMSVLFFKLLYPAARITAFEPAPDAVAVLRENVAGLEGVTVEQKALSAEEGEVEFFAFPGEAASPRSGTLRQEGAERTATVDSTPLSPYVDGPVDLLKLDVEGRELEVLRELAAAGKLPEIARMVIEVHHSPDYTEQSVPGILSLLEEHGFDYRVRAPLDSERWRAAGQDFWLYVTRRAPAQDG
jgi:FkbM family methyltransferase